MSLGRSFEDRPKLEAQFFRNFSCCGLDLQDLHGLLEHFEECHVAFDDREGDEGGMDVDMELDAAGSEGTISGPPSPRLPPGQPPRSIYEMKHGALHRSSPLATGNLNLDGGMELDMDMDDAPAPPTSSGLAPRHTISISTPGGTGVGSAGGPSPSSSYPPPMSAFDSPLSLSGGSNKKKFSTAMNALQMGGGGMRGLGGAMGGMMGLDALAAARVGASAYSTPDSSVPGTPVMEETPGGGVDGLFSVGTAHQVAPQPHPLGVGLAPSLLFPHSTAGSVLSHAPDSPPSDSGSNHEGSNSGRDSKESTPMYSSKPASSAAAAAAAAAAQSTPAAHPIQSERIRTAAINSNNSKVALVFSAAGRPLTGIAALSDKPFKCGVANCDKSYKQQNGLKYHRLHGNCQQLNVGKSGSESRKAGKPYVCHSTVCAKRYKK